MAVPMSHLYIAAASSPCSARPRTSDDESSLHVSVCIYMCVCVCVYIYTYICVCVCVCVCFRGVCRVKMKSNGKVRMRKGMALI
jgi:hypothetical protein